MNIEGNTILITGGGTGIGKALATRFLERGNEVIVCGRRNEVLDVLKKEYPKVHTRNCDVASSNERKDLAESIIREFPALNVLVNNAGIQRRVDLTKETGWGITRSEIDVNLNAPINLCQLFYPHFAQKQSAAFINVTSGLSFVPLANAPIYCATKAALHSFTLSLRWQFKDSRIAVVEVIPPAVDTDLQAPGLHTFGVNLDEFADHVFAELEKGESEIAFGTALNASRASREELDVIFKKMNSAFR